MLKVKNWLKRYHYDFKEVKLTSGDSAIMVNTNYHGFHPNKDVFRQHDHIQKYVDRHTKFKAEPRGHYTALLIR